VFACVFGGALFGMFLGTILPEGHLSPDARDVIKVAMAMVATLAALVLGLLTASAKSSLDQGKVVVHLGRAEIQSRSILSANGLLSFDLWRS